jgi:hypothetical protein
MIDVFYYEKSGRKRPGENVICKRCGTSFIRRKAPSKGKKPAIFCSRKCAGLASRTRVSMTCEECGKEFEKSKSRLKSSSHHFCSRACKDKAQRLDGISDMHPSHYGSGNNYRSLALREYIHKCEVCGYNRDVRMLQVHHVDGDRENNDIANLVVMCPNCHYSITMGLATFSKDRVYAWIV